MTTLREALNARHEADDPFTMQELVAVVVPLVTAVAELHEAGTKLYLHPSCVAYDVDEGGSILEEASLEAPTEAADKACIAPEERSGEPGDARSSVFSIGAMLYEMATLKSVGPGMVRPSDVNPSVSFQFEALLGKALVSDRAARPADLGALAQALHSCSPTASIAPPAADESHLDHDDDFEVDISLSMLPPAPKPGEVSIPKAPRVPVEADGPASGPISAPMSSATAGATAKLADMKAALESDPRPRYVVIKDGMDHGPFSAVELLKQIAQSHFRKEHFLRDTLSQEEKQIAEWAEFAPFAEHAGRGREAKKERANLEAKVEEEKVKTQNYAFIGGAALILVAAVGLGWWYKARASDDATANVEGDEAQAIDFEGGLEEGDKKGPRGTYKGGGKVVAGDGSTPPQLGGGMSCEAAQAAYVEDYSKRDVPPDLTAGAYGAVLNRGTYLNSCGVPPNMSVSICAAVQNGRAVGVTVITKPSNPGIAGCVRSAVAGMGFPAHPRLDVSRTHFKAE